jgi:hypothetical protein
MMTSPLKRIDSRPYAVLVNAVHKAISPSPA